MTTLFSDPRFLEHETGPHLESPARLAAVHRMLDETGLRGRCAAGECRAADTKTLHRVHTPEYLSELEMFDQSGGGQIDADTVMGPRSLEVARLAAGSACAAVDVVCSTPETSALVLSRPPGHHALSHAAMGFCLFNNIAIAAAHARDVRRLDRLLIVDWDVHHGNGTQDIFYDDGRVGYVSIHRAPFYPGTGSRDETGAGGGLGTTWNLPIAFGTPRTAFRNAFATALETAAERMRPELILISAGFDAHAADPIGSLGLESEDFGELTRMVREVARAHAGGRTVSVLEGGYNPDKLAESVQAHLEALLAPT